MAFVELTERDINSGKVVDPAWYRVRIDSVGEAPAKASEKGPSTNYPVEGTILMNADNGSKDFAGLPVQWNFNSKALGFTVGFLSALGAEVKPGRVNLQAAEGKEIDVYIENGEWQGRIVNRINHKYRKPVEQKA
jgi:hypothetical protein